MHRFAIALIGIVLAACVLGCSTDPSAKLIGRWEAELAPPTVDTESFGGKLQGAFLSLMKMTLEFRSDGKLSFAASVMGKESNVLADWKYLRSEGNVLVLAVGRDGKSTETRVTVVDNDHIELIPPAGGPATEPLSFKRVPADGK